MNPNRVIKLPKDEPTKILVLAIAGIGDTLLCTPMLKLLRQNYPQAHIVLMVMYRPAGELFELCPYVDEVRTFTFFKEGYQKSWKFLSKLRKERYDLCINTYPSNRWEYNAVCYLAGARERISHIYPIGKDFKTGYLFHNSTVLQKGDLHNVEENIQLLKLLGIEDDMQGHQLEIFLSEEDRNFANQYLRERNIDPERDLIIGFHAGTGETKNLHLRRWPMDRWTELGDYLISEKGAKVLIFGGPNEYELKEKIKSAMKKEPILVNDTNFRQSVALVGKCKYFISNDSALMHVSAAMKVPTLAIFGPTNIKWVYPYGTLYAIVTKNFECSPCYFYSKDPLLCKTDQDFACIKKITVNDILTGLKKLIELKHG